MTNNPIREIFNIIRSEDDHSWQALDYLNLYRFFVSLLLIAICFSPFAEEILITQRMSIAKPFSVIHTVTSIALIAWCRWLRRYFNLQVIISYLVDLITLMIMIKLMGGLSSGAGVLIIGSVMMSGVILKRKGALFFAALTTLLMISESVFQLLNSNGTTSEITTAGMLGVVYFAVAMVGSYLARRTVESAAIASMRAEKLVNMQRLNELIVEQMNTGVLLVKNNEVIHVLNNAGFYFLGLQAGSPSVIKALPDELEESYQHWSKTGVQKGQTLQLGVNSPETIARFARMGVKDNADRLIFLEDAGLVSQKAQQIALVSLGRLSATIAHEIRNPLAAISHSAQLLAESSKLSDADLRLSSIIGKHCRRMNDIIENVLHLARQKDADSHPIDLNEWMSEFVDEFRSTQNLVNTTIDVTLSEQPVKVVVDVSQLQQVLWNLSQNAVRYGGKDGVTRINIRTALTESGRPILEITDQGEGISESMQDKIFQPFFTTSDEGSGLGLYLCKQLCDSNRITLLYSQPESGGSTFTLRFDHHMPV